MAEMLTWSKNCDIKRSKSLSGTINILLPTSKSERRRDWHKMAKVKPYGAATLVLGEGEKSGSLVGGHKLTFRLTFEDYRTLYRFVNSGKYWIDRFGEIVRGDESDGRPITTPWRQYNMPNSLMRALMVLARRDDCEIVIESAGKWQLEMVPVFYGARQQMRPRNVWKEAVLITLCTAQPIRRATKLLEAVCRKLSNLVDRFDAELVGASIECV